MCQHSLARGHAGSMRRGTGGHAVHSGGGSFVRRLGFYIYAFCRCDEVVYIRSAAARLKSFGGATAVQFTSGPPGGHAEIKRPRLIPRCEMKKREGTNAPPCIWAICFKIIARLSREISHFITAGGANTQHEAADQKLRTHLQGFAPARCTRVSFYSL